MRRVILLLSVLAQLSYAKLTGEFMTGFETGAVLRSDDNALLDYSCSKPEIVRDNRFFD